MTNDEMDRFLENLIRMINVTLHFLAWKDTVKIMRAAFTAPNKILLLHLEPKKETKFTLRVDFSNQRITIYNNWLGPYGLKDELRNDEFTNQIMGGIRNGF